MGNEATSNMGKKAEENESVVINASDENSSGILPPPISEDGLMKQIEDKDTARIVAQLLQGQRIASVYIDARSGGVFFGGEAHVAGDVIGRGQVKQTARLAGRAYAETIAGYVLSEDLNKTRSVYVKPPRYNQAQQVLSEKHVLILWGQAHWGKWTTALHLLSSLQFEDIFEAKPDIGLEDIFSFKIETRKGYVIDTLAPDSGQKLSTSALNCLGEHFRKKDSYLVVTVDSRVPLSKTAVSSNLVIWNDMPDSTQLLKKHLEWYVTDQDARTAALELTQTNEVQQLLDAHLLPGEVDRLTELLVSVVHTELELAEALSRFETCALQHVEEWFETHTEPEKRTFMISLAVLSGASYQAVSSADERLQSLVQSATGESESSDTGSVFRSRSQRVQEACAHLTEGYGETEFGRSPMELIELNNPTFQPTVLHHVWNEYDRLHEPLVDWLKDLGIQANFEDRVRVAAAVGELSKYDFGYIKEQILLPWANHQDKGARAAAAFALGIPVWEGEFAPQVLGLLHHWSTLRNNWRLNWTAAAAYGGLVSLRFPDIALRNLHNIAQAEDLRLFAVLNRSVVNLFHAGQVEPDYYFKVLDALVAWTSTPSDKTVALTGLLVFLDLVLEAKTEAVPNAEKWPTLLWLSQENTAYRERIVSLWRRALNTRLARKSALETLQQLLKEADKDVRLYVPIEQVIRDLVQQGATREQDRLRYYLNRWATDSKERSTSAECLLTVFNSI